MTKIFKKKILTKRHYQSKKIPPTKITHHESDQVRKVETMQQDDINKEIQDFKSDNEEVREFQREDMIKKKLQKLFDKLPKEDRLRNLIDEDYEAKNRI